jgi:hypothetical protein
LGFGRTLCAVPVGLMIDRFGQALVLASLSVLRENKKDLKMTATFGLNLGD